MDSGKDLLLIQCFVISSNIRHVGVFKQAFMIFRFWPICVFRSCFKRNNSLSKRELVAAYKIIVFPYIYYIFSWFMPHRKRRYLAIDYRYFISGKENTYVTFQTFKTSLNVSDGYTKTSFGSLRTMIPPSKQWCDLATLQNAQNITSE